MLLLKRPTAELDQCQVLIDLWYWGRRYDIEKQNFLNFFNVF